MIEKKSDAGRLHDVSHNNRYPVASTTPSDLNRRLLFRSKWPLHFHQVVHIELIKKDIIPRSHQMICQRILLKFAVSDVGPTLVQTETESGPETDFGDNFE